MYLFKDLTRLPSALGTALLSLMAAPALAQSVPFVGEPVPQGIALQPAATSLATEMHWIDNMLNVIITAITIFVCVLLVWVIVRYNRRANPVPARFTHNSSLEVAWTILPIFILIFIGSFTVPALLRQQIMPVADVTIKGTGDR